MEQLTQDLASSLKVSGGNGNVATSTSSPAEVLPELPPARAPRKGMTLEETVADLKQHPLFMTELDDDEDNADLQALQALAYDGTPLENAANFKEQGNDSFRARRWTDAKEFYTKGVALLTAEERRRANGEVKEDDDSEDQVRQQRALLEQLHVNRAACHLELRNYRSCTLDCAAALRLNPSNVKAFYRSARALLAVDKIAEADDACARGLELDANNKPLRDVAQSIIDRAQALDAKRKATDERETKARRREFLVRAALRAQGIRTRTTGQPPEMEDAHIALVPDPDDEASNLSFPTVLLYPLHHESDFIKAFNEADTLEQHLAYVFPLPWDTEALYSPPSSPTGGGAVECYMETATGGLIKVGRRVPLRKVLSTPNVEVVDELVKIFIVPKTRAAAWVDEFKKKKAATTAAVAAGKT